MVFLSISKWYFLSLGEYAAIGVDVETYKVNQATQYLVGLVANDPPAQAMRVFKSYLAVAPSPSPSYTAFSKEVNRRLQMPPFNFINPLEILGGLKVVSMIFILIYNRVYLFFHTNRRLPHSHEIRTHSNRDNLKFRYV